MHSQDEEEIKAIIYKIAYQNDQRAFRNFFDYYFPRFLRITHYYVHNNETAEEVVMDVFTRLWKKRKKLPEIINFNNYAYTLLKNQALNYLKKIVLKQNHWMSIQLQK